MILDLTTLVVVATCLTALLGVFLVFLWLQERSVRALAWWGAAYLIGGSAVALWGMQPTTSPLLPAQIPNALLFISTGMIWNGARLFQGRQALPFPLIAGAMTWLMACQFTAFVEWPAGRIGLTSLIIATYTFLTASELWHDRRRTAVAKWQATLVPLLHGAVFLSPVVLIMLFPGGDSTGGWFALFAVETMLYVVGTAFIVVIKAKERSEAIHKTAAETDPLTSLFNRRAFFAAGAQMLAKRARRGQPVSVMIFDLDRFKSINDRFGHHIGDAALKLFAKTASTNLRTTDIVGRLGGEEFIAILPSALDEAAVAAERVRAAFEVAGKVIEGHAMAATVSIGVSCSPNAASALEPIIMDADAALYRAKNGGRNRVVTAAEADADKNASAPEQEQIVIPELPSSLAAAA